MAEIINLRQVRKARARANKDAEAQANRAKFGRSKAEKDLEVARQALADKSLEGHKRDESEL